MGTRGIYGFERDAQLKISYNHYDSYPTGSLAQKVITFILSTTDKEMNEIFDRIILIRSDEETPPELVQISKDLRLYDLSVSRCKISEPYCALRNIQGDLLAYKRYPELKWMIDAREFFTDTSLCEWGYVINLTEKDDPVLNIYKRGNRLVKTLQLSFIRETCKNVEEFCSQIYNTILL